MYTLEILAGEGPLRNVHIEDEVIVVGTLETCDIQLEGDDIQEKHLALEMKQGQLKMYDLANGDRLKLNGEAVRSAEVHHEDIIELGLYRLKVLLDEARNPQRHEPIGVKRPWGLMQGASMVSVMLMLIMQMVFIFFVSMRWRSSEIKEKTQPVIQLAQGAPSAPLPKPAPQPKPPKPEPPTVTAPVGGGNETPVPAPPPATPAAPKPAVPEPVVPAPEKPPVPVAVSPRPAPAPKPTPKPKPEPPVEVTPKPEPPKPVPPKPAPDPLVREKKMLAEARALIKKKDWIGADRLLSSLQRANPKFLDAYAERAVVLEYQGQFKEAIRQWEQIVARGPRHAKFNEALRSRDRLREKIKLAAAPAPAPKPVPPPKPVVPKKEQPVEFSQRKIYISAVEIQRYDKNERFDEMRLLTIVLKPRSASQRLAGPDITVEVAFFDQEVKSGKIVPTKALVPESLFQLSGRIRLSEPPNLNAAYVVPKGFRKKQMSTTKRDMRFYGYRIQLYYKGVLQHQISKPDSLLKAVP